MLKNGFLFASSLIRLGSKRSIGFRHLFVVPYVGIVSQDEKKTSRIHLLTNRLWQDSSTVFIDRTRMMWTTRLFTNLLHFKIKHLLLLSIKTKLSPVKHIKRALKLIDTDMNKVAFKWRNSWELNRYLQFFYRLEYISFSRWDWHVFTFWRASQP